VLYPFPAYHTPKIFVALLPLVPISDQYANFSTVLILSSFQYIYSKLILPCNITVMHSQGPLNFVCPPHYSTAVLIRHTTLQRILFTDITMVLWKSDPQGTVILMSLIKVEIPHSHVIHGGCVVSLYVERATYENKNSCIMAT